MGTPKAKKTKKKRLSRWLTRGLDKLPGKVAGSLPVKALCFFGCADEKLGRSYKESFISRLFGKLKFHNRVVQPAKRSFATGVENSRVLEWIFRILNFFYTLPVVFYGILLFAVGLTLCGAAAISAFMQGLDTLLSLSVLDFPMAIPGIVLLFVSLPLLIVEAQPLSTLVEKSRFGQNFLCGFLGLDPVCIRRGKTSSRYAGGLMSVLALVLGVGVGIVTLYVSASAIPVSILIVMAVVVVMTAPEAGLMLIGMLIPLLNTTRLCMLVTLTLVSFMVKLLRGKRSLRMTMTDVVFLLLAVVIFVECVMQNSGKSYGYMLILFCFVAVTGSHLLRSQGVLARFQRALMFSSLVSISALALDTALQFIPAYVLRDIPLSAYSDYVIGNFGSRVGVGLYLFVMFPFVVSALTLSDKVRSRMRYFLYALVILAGFVMLQSRTILLGSIVLVAMILLMRTPRHLITLLIGIAGGVCLFLFLLPDRYVNMVVRQFADSDSHIISSFVRFGDMFMESAGRYFSGVGFGRANGDSLYTILLSALGLGGLILFVLLMLLLLGYATVSTLRNRSAGPKLYPTMIACYTSIIGVLFIAMHIPVLDTPAVLLAFCMVCGFTMGVSRTMRKNAVFSEAVSELDIEFSPIHMQGGNRYE